MAQIRTAASTKLTTLLVALATWTGAARGASAAAFTYDSSSGHCLDANGQEGLNALDVEALLGDPVVSSNGEPTVTGRDAQCVDLSGFNLNRYFQAHHYRGYFVIVDGDFRGALFKATDLHFVIMKNAHLEGADLSQAKFGYTTLDGTADSHTQARTACQLTSSTISCRL